MIYKPAGRRFYMVKFRFEGKLIHKATKATTRKVALDIQAQIRSELAKGNWGVLKAKPMPTLAEFLRSDFLPYAQTKHALKTGHSALLPNRRREPAQFEWVWLLFDDV